MIITRTRLAVACAIGLGAAGLVACSDGADTAKDTVNSAQEKLDKAGEAAVNGASKANEAASKAASDAAAAGKEAADAAASAASKVADAAKDSGKDTKDAAKEAVESAKVAASSAASAAKDAANDVADAAKKADADVTHGDMVEVTDTNGATVEIPAAIATEAKKLGESSLGKLVSVKHVGEDWVASYAHGWHIAYSKATGAQPVKGKIGQVWFDGGNVSNPVGLPTAPEQTKPNNQGWDQSFTKGTIWAGMDGTSGTEMK